MDSSPSRRSAWMMLAAPLLFVASPSVLPAQDMPPALQRETARSTPAPPNSPATEAPVTPQPPLQSAPNSISVIGDGRGRGRGAFAPASPRPVAATGPTCTFDATIYDVRMPLDQIGRIDAAMLSSAAANVAEFEKALAAIGTSQPAYRFGQSVRLSETLILSSAEIPYVTNSNINMAGQTINSVAYRQIGAIIDLIGKVNAPNAIDLEMSLQVSNIADSAAAISPNFKAPLFRNFTMSHKGRVIPNQPFVLVSIDAGTLDSNGKAVACIARITMGTPQQLQP